MSFNNDGLMDPDEAMRTLDLLSYESGADFHMSIENKGKKLQGEIDRVFGADIEMLEIGGYYYVADVIAAPGSTKGVLRIHPFLVVRDCDAATASIASMLSSQDADLIVNILVFKAGGDSAKDLQPFFQIELTGARIARHAIVTGGRPKRPCEIIQFRYRAAEIKSAPQQQSGLRGAVRTARMLAA